jgi:hypothetical protein
MMITFETQEDFEAAVMDVIAQRLEVIVEGGGLPVNALIEVSLIDNEDNSVFASSYV